MKYRFKTELMLCAFFLTSSILAAGGEIHKPNFRALADLAHQINQSGGYAPKEDKDAEADDDGDEYPRADIGPRPETSLLFGMEQDEEFLLQPYGTTSSSDL